MQALGSFLVVMPGEKASERKGIFLPESAQEQSNRAEVVAVGPDVKHIAVGDTILIPMMTLARVARTQAVDLMIEDKPALVLSEADIAVVWPKEIEAC